MQRISNGTPAGQAVVLESSGAWRDGRSADGTYLASGYPYLLMKNRDTEEIRTLFTGPTNGKAPGDTSQVCNASVCQAPGAGDRVLHLDFGSNGTVSTLTGTAYGVHQYLFVTDYAGITSSAYRCPVPGWNWDHPEWSNHPDFAAASVQQPDGNHPVAGGLDLRDSSFISLARSRADLWHPYLWIDPATPYSVSPVLDLDCVGRYWSAPHINERLYAVASTVMRIWANRDSIEVACIGSSRMYQGVNPTYITRGSACVLAWSGASPEGMNTIALDYVATLCPNVKAIVFNFCPGYMCMTPSERFYRPDSVFTQSTGYIYDREHRFWRDSLPSGLVTSVLRAPTTHCDTDDPLRGFKPSECGSWNSPHGPAYADSWTVADTQYVRRHAELVAVADSLAARNIHLVMISFPFSPGYRLGSYYARYGPLRTVAHDIIDDMRELDASNPYFHFHDENKDSYHDYPPELAHDDDHLCTDGAQQLSTRVDSILHAVLP